MNFSFTDKFDIIIGKELSLRIIEKQQGKGAMLPFYYWDILVGTRTVGKISLRVGRNFHSYYNGNIGYEIDELYRGHRYSQKACELLLPVAEFHGMKELLLTCRETNIASYKVIESLGAELLEITEAPREYFAWKEGMERQRIYSWSVAAAAERLAKKYQ